MLYVITDPCYLIHVLENKDQVWDKFCDLLDYVYKNDNEQAAGYLAKNLGLSKMWVSSTGFGDWTNEIVDDVHNPNVKILNEEFCADSGLVCVCPVTEEFLYKLTEKFGDVKEFCAIIDASEDCTVNFNRDCSDWTVVEFTDNSNKVHLYSLLPSEMDNYDDNDFEDDEYDK